MDKDEALTKLEREWKERGVAGAQPTLMDLALALARAGVTSDEEVADKSPAGGDPALPKAE